MKKKPELDDLDVVFDSTPLTEEEKRLISEYIQQDKTKRRKKRYAQHHLSDMAVHSKLHPSSSQSK